MTATHGTILERFEDVAAAHPDRLALRIAGCDVSYGSLARAGRAAASAIAMRVAGDGPVVLLLEDWAAFVAALLGAWRTGRICVPVDSRYSAARIDAIARDVGASLLVTDAREGAAAMVGCPVLEADALAGGREGGAAAVFAPQDPGHPAYVIYTSGSTGVPKGVVQTHRNVLHRIRGVSLLLGLSAEDRIGTLHSPGFFPAQRDIWCALLGGATLSPHDARAGSGALRAWLAGERITVLSAVVTVFRHVLDGLAPDDRFPDVRVVRLGSEPVHAVDLARAWRHFADGCQVQVGYASTEATGISQHAVTSGTAPEHGRLAAGYPMDGMEILILDEAGLPAPAGTAGEIAVRSAYLSPGYWGQPEMTAAVFRPDPAGGEQRIYLTGDVGRLAPDGCLEVLGRKDEQVKVRGNRVHPGEIEMTLAAHPGIRAAAVVARETGAGDTVLTAYAVPAAAPGPPAEALRRFLRARLADFMVPAAVVLLESLPLTPNGKVDRRALPAPPPSSSALHGRIVLAADPLEDQIAQIWEDLLDVRPVGRTDDFFDLGGHSLLAARMIERIEAVLGRRLTPADLLGAGTVADVAAAVLRAAADEFTHPVVALRRDGARPPIVFLHGDFEGGGLYCRALARALPGDQPLFAVHPHGLDGRRVPATIEAMAAERLDEVRDAVPRGPWILAGHCNGGLVALEMARRLLAEGAPVGPVVLVEAAAPGPGLRALRGLAGALARVHGGDGEEASARYLGWRRRGEALAAAMPDRWRYYARRLRENGAGGERRRRGPAAGPDGAARPISLSRPARTPLGEAYHDVIHRYVPRPYGGRLVVLRARETPGAVDLGWARLGARVAVEELPGDHFSCVTRHVGALAARLVSWSGG